MSDAILVRGRWVVTGGGEDDPVLTDAAVRVEDGGIAEVGDWETLRARHPDAAAVGSERVAIMPGMINAHHHSNGVSAIQQGVQDRLLESWLLSLALGRRLTPQLATLLSAARLLRTGVTSVVDVHSDRGTAESYAANAREALAAYDDAGIRVAFAAGLMTQCFLVSGAGEDEKFLAGLPDEDLRSFEEMRLAMRLHRTPRFDGPAPAPAQVLEMATTGGARLMGKEDTIGAIAPGRAADLVLVGLDRVVWPWVAPETDPRELLLMRARAGDVDTVMVGGKIVLRGGRPTRFDLDEVAAEAAAKLASQPFRSADALMIERLRGHVEAYYRKWEVPDLAPHTIYNARG